MNKIFLDVETTGLNSLKDKIIEICCLKIDYKNYKEELFHFFLNPEINVSKGAYMIHGIDNKFLKNKPLFKEIVIKFLNFIYNSKLIIHNAPFDIGFLNKELNILKFNKINKYCYKIIDTLKLSKKIYKDKKNSLDNLCKKFNFKNYRKKHSALIDVFLLKKVYYELYKRYNKIKLKIY
ncbi:DNA polymerase III epsilon subunit [Candidatus Nasuia deltocephalinicola]|uniref:DNA-directed DNA polymerase n=1 Tax=Candidatus Nasuia deltocephalincola TaxID=1160784 RepID=A0A0S2UP08_9PROT|nr:DNA polymerase III epsilon subunit [Candidatus Nasuia deltocephalinicola]